IVWLTADEEDAYIVDQSTSPLDENNRFVDKNVMGRHQGNNQEIPADSADFIDLSPKQLVAVATACIPFLENDDSKRAL
ncbi:hypothetical protein NF391_10090, partial [Streptococcus suis]|uniref:hypothetical protein n=1 Tax=Streptococcus suis TaxID=1307 RepID=UPI002117D28C